MRAETALWQLLLLSSGRAERRKGSSSGSRIHCEAGPRGNGWEPSSQPHATRSLRRRWRRQPKWIDASASLKGRKFYLSLPLSLSHSVTRVRQPNNQLPTQSPPVRVSRTICCCLSMSMRPTRRVQPLDVTGGRSHLTTTSCFTLSRQRDSVVFFAFVQHRRKWIAYSVDDDDVDDDEERYRTRKSTRRMVGSW